MKLNRSWIKLIVMALFASACAVQPSNGAPLAPRRNSNLITAEEISAASQLDAYSLVQALRPGWLRDRGKGSMSRPEFIKVYQDGMLTGGVGALRQISRDAIAEMRFFDGMMATQRWGTDHGKGAIEMITGSPR